MTFAPVADSALETAYVSAIAAGIVRTLTADEWTELMSGTPDLEWPDYTDAELSAFSAQSISNNSPLLWEA